VFQGVNVLGQNELKLAYKRLYLKKFFRGNNHIEEEDGREDEGRGREGGGEGRGGKGKGGHGRGKKSL
jgi:hypothetical protein